MTYLQCGVQFLGVTCYAKFVTFFLAPQIAFLSAFVTQEKNSRLHVILSQGFSVTRESAVFLSPQFLGATLN